MNISRKWLNIILVSTGPVVALMYFSVSVETGFCTCASKKDEVRIFVREIAVKALNAYQKDTGSYPSTKEGLRALVIEPQGATKWRGPYFNGFPKDPWGAEYRYTRPGLHHPNGYDLWSLGPSKGVYPQDIIDNW
jgi:general secretion pathway protein G